MTQASHISLPKIFCVAPTGVFRWADGNGSARSGMCFYLMGDSDAAFAFVRRLADDAFIVWPRICATYQRGVQTGQRADRRCWLLDHGEPACRENAEPASFLVFGHLPHAHRWRGRQELTRGSSGVIRQNMASHDRRRGMESALGRHKDRSDRTASGHGGRGVFSTISRSCFHPWDDLAASCPWRARGMVHAHWRNLSGNSRR